MQGIEGQKWRRKFDFDFDMLMNDLHNTMMWNEEWREAKAKWEKSEHLTADYDDHVQHLKLVATYAGMKAESRILKKILMRSLGPAFMSTAQADDKGGMFRDFRTMVGLAKADGDEAVFGSKGRPVSLMTLRIVWI